MLKKIVRFGDDGDVIWFNRFKDTAPVWFVILQIVLVFTLPPIGLILIGYDVAKYWEKLPEEE